MSVCSNVPVELILATTDPSLYTNNKWTWNGQLYWAAECLFNGQDTVSDRVVPNVPPINYLPLNATPSTWDFCKSDFCSSESRFIQLIFTFNPASTDPNDYLQYVIDRELVVTDAPRHSIRDSSGERLYFDIVQLSTLPSQEYIEVWVSKAREGQMSPVTPNLDLSVHDTVQQGTDKRGLVIGILIALVVLILIGILVFFLTRGTTKGDKLY